MSIFAILLLFFYDIPNFTYGGGVFYKLCQFINLKLFLFFSFIGAMCILISNDINKHNYIIFLIFIFAFPFDIVYQKYYDPLLLVVFLTLIKSDFIKDLIENENLKKDIIFGYYAIFLIASNIYYN